MNTIVINASPRRNWNTALMLKEAMKGAESAGAETEYIDLCDLNFSGCRSCLACKRKDAERCKCYWQDDLSPVISKILAADCLIIGTPIYFNEPTAYFRALLERLCFCVLSYDDGKTYFEGKLKIGVIYTMNCPDEHFYDALTGSHKNTFSRFFGETQVLCATETLQFDNYDLYVGDMFDVPRRREKHEKEFPEDRRRAFLMGQSLVK